MKINKASLNAIVSAIADPSLRKLAEKLAASVPEGSWLRSDFAERLIAGLKGFGEMELFKKSPTLGVFAEKFIDLLDFAGTKLFGKEEGEAKKVVSDWMSKFQIEAMKRVATVKKEELQAEFERLKEEFEIRKQIVAMIEAAMPKPPEPKLAQSVDWEEIKAVAIKTDNAFAGVLGKLNNWLDKKGVK